jgi:hypothetical protein
MLDNPLAQIFCHTHIKRPILPTRHYVNATGSHPGILHSALRPNHHILAESSSPREGGDPDFYPSTEILESPPCPRERGDPDFYPSTKSSSPPLVPAKAGIQIFTPLPNPRAPTPVVQLQRRILECPPCPRERGDPDFYPSTESSSTNPYGSPTEDPTLSFFSFFILTFALIWGILPRERILHPCAENFNESSFCHSAFIAESKYI